MCLGSSQRLTKHPCARSVVVSSSPRHNPWPRRRHWQPAVAVGSRRCGLSKRLLYQLRQLRPAVRSLSEDASKTLVQAFVSCRLDYCNYLFFGISDGLIYNEPAAVSSECRRSSGYWHSALRLHNAGAPSTTLATGTPAHRFQGCYTCSSVCVRKFCAILSWWLSSCHRHSWATTTFNREQEMRRYPDSQRLWWQSFCSCRSWAMEQFTATSQRCWQTWSSRDLSLGLERRLDTEFWKSWSWSWSLKSWSWSRSWCIKSHADLPYSRFRRSPKTFLFG